MPKISRIEPVPGSSNKKFRVIGEGFGTKGSVKFNDKGEGKEIAVTVSKWEDKQIEVDVSTELKSGMTVEIVVTNDNGKPSDPASYKIT